MSASAAGRCWRAAWDKSDLEALGCPRLDISTSAAMATAAARLMRRRSDDDQQAAWRMTRGRRHALHQPGRVAWLAGVAAPGARGESRRARRGPAIGSLEDLAQLLALWRPGACRDRTSEQAYLAARFGWPAARLFPSGPGRGARSDARSTAVRRPGRATGCVLGFRLRVWPIASAARWPRAVGPSAIAMERELKEAAKLRRWTDEQINGILGSAPGTRRLPVRATATPWRSPSTSCRRPASRSIPRRRAAFFCEMLNNGGSAHYGLGAAVEEARRWGVLILPPCVNRSTDRYAVRRMRPRRSSSSDQTATNSRGLARSACR